MILFTPRQDIVIEQPHKYVDFLDIRNCHAGRRLTSDSLLAMGDDVLSLKYFPPPLHF